ncbi:MAG: hypothetical protein Q8L21_02245, partial [Candidatus Komeilibacteria bacterium]|nr:hypothetical protein [Candidatus Komeilibacteria bacterium]
RIRMQNGFYPTLFNGGNNIYAIKVEAVTPYGTETKIVRYRGGKEAMDVSLPGSALSVKVSGLSADGQEYPISPDHWYVHNSATAVTVGSGAIVFSESPPAMAALSVPFFTDTAKSVAR